MTDRNTALVVGVGASAGLGALSIEAIAQAYWQPHGRRRSAWTLEADLRPWGEPF